MTLPIFSSPTLSPSGVLCFTQVMRAAMRRAVEISSQGRPPPRKNFPPSGDEAGTGERVGDGVNSRGGMERLVHLSAPGRIIPYLIERRGKEYA